MAALVGAIATACGTPLKVPTLSGIVQAIEPAEGAAGRYLLTGGEVVLDQGQDDQLYPPGRGSPRVGDLPIVGPDGSHKWYLVLPPGGRASGRECFRLLATGLDKGNAIDLTIGVRLPKTADFDRGPDTDGNYAEQPNAFCLDGRGAIFAWG